MLDDGAPTRNSQLAELYELWTLDVVSDVGVVAGTIFAMRPQQFKNVSATTVETLGVLRYRTGFDEEHLSADQRAAVCTPLLGASDGTRHDGTGVAFHQAAQGLRQAAADFVQRSFDSGEQQLRNAFRDASRSFAAYLTGVDGAVVQSAVLRLAQNFDDVVGVLRDGSFTGGLGLPAAPGDPWPRFGDLDGDGAALVQALDHEGASAGITTHEPLDEAEFVVIQRIADQGAASIDAVIADPGFPDDAAADAAINGVYRWWSALRDYRGVA
jgi:hypothetical protein